MNYDFSKNAPSNEMGATGSFPVVLSDTSFADGVSIRGVTINGSGTIHWKDKFGVLQTTNVLPIGDYALHGCTAILLATTATAITAWY